MKTRSDSEREGKMTRRILAVVCGFYLLVGGVLLAPVTVGAAAWLAMGENYGADWVKDVERELNKAEYVPVFVNDPRTPFPTVLRYLNNAAFAMKANQEAVAKDEVRRALEIFEDGVRKGYYSSADIQPIVNYVKTHVPIKVT
jgi:hypothetical protein